MSLAMKKYKETHSSAFATVTIKDILTLKDGTPFLLHDDNSITFVTEYFGFNIDSYMDDSWLEGRVQIPFAKIMNNLVGENVSVSFMKSLGAVSNVDTDSHEDIKIHEKARINKYNQVASQKFIKEERFFFYVTCHPKSATDISLIKNFILHAKGLLGIEYTSSEREAIERSTFYDIDHRQMIGTRAMEEIQSFLMEMGASTKTINNKKDLFRAIVETSLGRVNNRNIIFDESDSPRRQIFRGEKIIRSHKGFFFDGYFYRVYSMSDLPNEAVAFGDLEKVLLSFPYEYSYTFSLSPMNKEDTDRVFFTTKIKLSLKEMEYGQGGKRLDKEKRDVEHQEDEAIELGTELARISATIVIKIPEYTISEAMNRTGKSIERYIDDIDYELKTKFFARFGNSQWQPEERGHVLFFTRNAMLGQASVLSDMSLVNETNQIDVPWLLPLTSVSRRELRRDGINHYYYGSNINGIPISTIPFEHIDRELDAPNAEVFGGSGSGKSVFIQTLLTSFMSKRLNGKSKVIIRGCDIGGDTGSYDKWAEIYGGTILRFRGINKPTINFFDIVLPEKSRPKDQLVNTVVELVQNFEGVKIDPLDLERLVRSCYMNFSDQGGKNYQDNVGVDEYIKQSLLEDCGVEVFFNDEEKDFMRLKRGNCLLNDSDMNFILMLFDIMLAKNGNQRGGVFGHETNYKLITGLIEASFKKFSDRFPTISDIYEVALNAKSRCSSEERKRSWNSFLELLHPWTQKGQNPYFDMETSIDLNQSIIIADFNDLINIDETMSQVNTCFLMLINKLFTEDMYVKRNAHRMFFSDENWKIAKSFGVMRDFLVSVKRLARKYSFFNINGTQGPLDYMGHPDFFNAVKTNTFTYIIAGLGTVKGRDLRQICDIYGWEDAIAKLIGKTGKVLAPNKETGGRDVKYTRHLMIRTLKTGSTDAVLFDNILSPEEFEAYQSDNARNKIHNYYRSLGMGINEIIPIMVKGEFIHDDGLLEFLEKNAGEDEVLKIKATRKNIEEKNAPSIFERPKGMLEN